MGLILAFYAVYSVIRNTQGSAVVSEARALRNALRVIRWEKAIGSYHEEAIQQRFLAWDGFIEFWNLFYGTFHFFVTIFALVFLFRRFPARYRRWRNTLAATTALALIGFATYPLMPPRLLPASHGFVDTLRVYGSLWSFDSGAMSKISNQYAAMPSLHFAWATWCTLVLVPALKSWWAKALAIIYPAFTLFAIVVTANHFWLDAAGGLARARCGRGHRLRHRRPPRAPGRRPVPGLPAAPRDVRRRRRLMQVVPRTADAPPSLGAIAARVEDRIRVVLDEELARWAAVDAELIEPFEALRELVLAGGKRLRPAFCHWAFVGAGGDPTDRMVVDAGAALELLHTFALIHDDIMDGSPTRRAMDTIHVQFEARHARDGWRGEGRRFGEGVAILAGDLAFVYADRMLAGAPRAAMEVFTELRIEVNVGQYLDLVGTARGRVAEDAARRICRFKSGKYTIERPLHLGAALAGRHARAGRAPERLRPAPGRGVPAARRPPGRLRRRHRHRQAGGGGPAGGQAHGACTPWPRRPSAGRARPSTATAAPTSPTTRSSPSRRSSSTPARSSCWRPASTPRWRRPWPPSNTPRCRTRRWRPWPSSPSTSPAATADRGPTRTANW